MFFDDIKNIKILATKTNFSIFVGEFFDFSKIKKLFPANTLTLSPDEKTDKISVDAIRDFTSLASSKEPKARFFLVDSAEKLNESAENAFLKSLEEPKENVFFCLFVKNLSALLPTTRSRAQIYYQRFKNSLSSPVDADEKVKALAKRLIVAKPTDLISIATEIAEKKPNARVFALKVVATAIEILYKSFFATKNEKLLIPLANLFTLYSDLENNGHIKLAVLADML